MCEVYRLQITSQGSYLKVNWVVGGIQDSGKGVF